MSDLYFPSLPGVVLAAREPFFVNATQTSDNGKRLVIKKRSAVGYRFVFNVKFLRVAEGEHTTMFNFFETHAGSYDSFLYTDPQGSVDRRVHFVDDDLALQRDGNGLYYTGEITLETVVV